MVTIQNILFNNLLLITYDMNYAAKQKTKKTSEERAPPNRPTNNVNTNPIIIRNLFFLFVYGWIAVVNQGVKLNRFPKGKRIIME